MDKSKIKKRIKVAIIQRRIAPFRVPFFERINQESNIEITVFYAFINHIPSIKFNIRKYRIKKIKIFSSDLEIGYSLLLPLLRGRYDVIVFEGSISLVTSFVYIILLRLLFRKKICWWSSGWEPFNTSKIKKVARNFLYFVICHISNNIIAYSSKAKRYYEYLKKIPAKVFIAHNVLDCDIYLESEREVKQSDVLLLKKNLNIREKKVLLFVGKIERKKKVPLLLEAYKIMMKNSWFNKIALVIVGDGSEKKRLENLAKKELLPNVHFIGKIANPVEIATYFKTADIFVLPGAGGLAIYNAMIFGLPIVVSYADGTEEDLVINEETGFYFKENSAKDLAGKLSLILTKGDDYLRMIGGNARRRALKDFSIEKMVKGFRSAILY
jgi:glycosyltransferase involved in cell wall biosynthesis